MSLIFKRTSRGSYLYQPRRGISKIVLAFLAGGICAALIVREPGDAMKFTEAAPASTALMTAVNGSTDGSSTGAGKLTREAQEAGKEAGTRDLRDSSEVESKSAIRSEAKRSSRATRLTRSQAARNVRQSRESWAQSQSQISQPRRGVFLAPFRLNAPSLTR